MAVLTGKAAVFAGGSRGIGRAVVLRLARDGAAVVFNYAQNREAANDVVRQAEEAGGRVTAVQLDLAERGRPKTCCPRPNVGSTAWTSWSTTRPCTPTSYRPSWPEP
ncbi:SDR family NAD(P)-dependent oxidoreductase [Streptomyces sp. NPDC001599]|uniref:SDR family NAD(P)-dependent oxidoreductase n=1 Tax=Streptomyces sp. NPDC001599 TaxID=3364591 RepID=UPI0036BE748D